MYFDQLTTRNKAKTIQDPRIQAAGMSQYPPTYEACI